MFMRGPGFLILLAALAVFAFPQYAAADDAIGMVSEYTVRPDDTLYKIARRFDLGAVELVAANPGINTKPLKAGQNLTLPTRHLLPAVKREGIVIDLSVMRLFYFSGTQAPLTFPVAVGRKGWETRTGITTVVMKRRHPAWVPPDSIRAEDPALPAIVPPGPNNPLGDHALSLGWEGYLIHGTNSPSSIGKRVSHGCIRLYPEDIAVLFAAVKEGTPVTIINGSRLSP